MIRREKQAPNSSGRARVVLRCADDVLPEPFDWLWEGWLAAGKVHLIGGAPGSGKTTLAVTLAATVTRGGLWPDRTVADVGSVIIWSGEDDHADTLNPRFRAAEADMSKVHVVEGLLQAGRRTAFDPARDMDKLREAAREIPDLRLIIVDPIVSAVAGNSHQNSEVRRSLQPLVDLANDLHCAVIGVTHFSKGTAGRDPVERVTGSLAFTALARFVMVTAKHQTPHGVPERMVLVRAKSNFSSVGGGYAYELRHDELEGFPGVTAVKVVWGEEVRGSARDILALAEAHDEEGGATYEAIALLEATLAKGEVRADEMAEIAQQSGISPKALRRARESIGVKVKRVGFGPGSHIVWSLPPTDADSMH